MPQFTAKSAFIVASIAFSTIAGTQSVGPSQAAPASAPVAGYLPAAAVPSSALLVPTPPTSGSAAMARDEETNRSALAMHGTPRWEMAARDAVLTFPAAAATFSCALDVPVSDDLTPRLITLLRRTLVDAGRATGEAKQLYKRARPFMSNGKPICTPEREEGLRRDGSYPSGHSSVGWAFGLVLSEVAPDRENALLLRAREFGNSRLVCNVHWQSDVEEGRMVASAVVARLNADSAFREDVAAARSELDALRAKHLRPAADCEAEARVLKSWN